MPTLSELEAKYFVMGAGVHHSGDTTVIPHVDAESYFAAIYDAIDALVDPDDAIYIASWFISDTLLLKPPIATEFRLLLHNKAALGMDVRVIVWTGRFMIGKGLMDADEWWHTASFISGAEEAGGFVNIVQLNIKRVLAMRDFNPGGLPQPPLRGSLLMDYGGGKFGCRHQKYTVIYRKSSNDLRAFIGGIDFDESRFSRPHHPIVGLLRLPWHDAGVELRGGAAASVWTDFRTRWEEAKTLPSRIFRVSGVTHGFNNPATVNRPPVPVAPQAPINSTSSVRVLRSYAPFRESPVFGDDLPWTTVPSDGVQEVFLTYTKALNAATNYIYIEDQALNTHDIKVDHDMLWPLIIDAANRDVKVIFIVSGTPDPTDPGHNQNEDPSGSLMIDLVERILIHKRINFVMYRVNGTIIHSKVVLIDDEFAAIGSANFFDRSMEGLDTELQAAIVDPTTLVRDFRIKLWADHLHVDPADATVQTELGDLTKSLGLFRPEWATGGSVTFPHPNSQLRQVPTE